MVAKQIVIYAKSHSSWSGKHVACASSENLRFAAYLKYGFESNPFVTDRFLGVLGADAGGGNRSDATIIERQSLVQHIDMCFRAHDDENAVGYISLCSLIFGILKEFNQKPAMVVGTNVFREVGYLFIVGLSSGYLLKDRLEPLLP